MVLEILKVKVQYGNSLQNRLNQSKNDGSKQILDEV